ncbi:DUF4843 domain-containing protein [Pedobacter frigoris]|uniref:DUF4843 domain-containing protein n=1 Tax=Pedobacter frigoris TaxID=2571272 RepID=A0A4U1CIU0_9SPHI|nr:DUF4843 domain-containing protein [Pedobacter frigoris]TKC05976.1 DUF4843 domain-containing protein [Pedobacter frigoris]
MKNKIIEMKKILKNFLMVLLPAVIMASCTKNKELLYNEADMVYVESIPDSTDYTFAASPASLLSDSIMVNFRIIGKASDKDRTINFVPTATSTGKAGYHYKVGNAVIKANTFSARIPIYVYRRAGLKDSTLTVNLMVTENSDFKPGYPSRLRYKFTLTDILTKPSNWESTWAAYFGTYSEVKFRFLIAVTGKTNWNSGPLPQDSRFLSQKARNALLEYNQQNGALIDEFGQQVFFP